MDHDDQQCVLRCRSGHADAFGELVDRYQLIIFNAVYWIVGSRERAVDLTRRIFFRAHRDLGELSSPRHFFEWLCEITIDETCLGEDHPSAPVDSSQRGTEDELARLGRDDRVAIVLRHFLRCSYREAAEILGISPDEFERRLFEARRRLGEALRDEGCR